jgi:hypothetical protein
MVFVFARGETRPSVVMKVAFTREEAAFLTEEFHALSGVRRATSGRIMETIPEPLALEASGQGVILALRVLDGRRPLVPDLTRRGSPAARRLMRGFLASSFGWSRDLAAASGQPRRVEEGELEELVEGFLNVYRVTGQPGSLLRSFGRSVGRARISWTPCWQHRDISVGNVLFHRGNIRLIDWEHAAGACEPWFDTAYTPGASVLLARRQAGSASVREAALISLNDRHWFGRLLAQEMKKTWQYPLPLPWAVTLTAMSTALRRERNGRVGWTDWADFALCLLADKEFREAASWLAVDW